MNTLITGCDGFVGANLCKALLEQGHYVVGAALSRQGHTSLDALDVDVRLEYGDILDAAYVERLINAYEIQWVFHLAGVATVRVAEASPARCLRTNIMGTINVLDACLQAEGIQTVLIASSDKAYGDYGDVAYKETMPLQPVGAYEVSKACADLIARCYGSQYGPRTIITRCANMYGPGDLHWSRLVPNSCRLALAGERPQINAGAWDHQRDWLYIDDAIDAYLLLAEQGNAGEAYNIGTGTPCLATTGEVARAISDLAHGPPPTEIGRRIKREIPAQSLDIGKITALGWKPETWLGNGLSKTVTWYREYFGGQDA